MNVRLQQIIREVCKSADRDPGAHERFRDIPGWDSLAHMDIIAAVESAFGIEFTGDEIADMQTVGDMWKTVEHRSGAAAR